jgi:FAD/FMN-containing dehydrogenase
MEETERRNLAEDLANIVGEKYVRTDDVTRWSYALNDFGGAYFYPLSEKYGAPDIVVKPHTVEEISEIVKLANNLKVAIIPRGGGGDMTGAATPLKSRGGITLDTLDMRKIIRFQDGLNAVRVQPGIRWGELHHECKKRGVSAGCWGPHGFLGASLGGGIAGNCFSINSPKYGWLNENVLNLQVVLPNGDIIETGSLANTKITDWYFRYCNGPDLVGIFMGGAGAFGIITEFTLRTHPLPEYSSTICFTFPDCDSQSKFLHHTQWNNYFTEAWGFAYFALHPSVKRIVKPLIGERDIVVMTTEAVDKDIYKAQKKAIRKISKRFNGQELPIEGLTRALNVTVIDTTGWAAGGVYGKIMGPNDTCTCSIAPILDWGKVTKGSMKVLEKNQDKLSGSLPMIDGDKFYLYPQLVGGGQVVQSVAATPVDYQCGDRYTEDSPPVDPNDLTDNVQAAKNLYDKLWSYNNETGAVTAYRIGKENPSLIRNLKPEYKKFMRLIKKTLDPNNIMNPGVLGFDEEE